MVYLSRHDTLSFYSSVPRVCEWPVGSTRLNSVCSWLLGSGPYVMASGPHIACRRMAMAWEVTDRPHPHALRMWASSPMLEKHEMVVICSVCRHRVAL